MKLSDIKRITEKFQGTLTPERIQEAYAYMQELGYNPGNLYQELEMDVCPKCGSQNLTKIERMNGYLSYSRIHGDTRLNEAKMAEIAERKSM